MNDIERQIINEIPSVNPPGPLKEIPYRRRQYLFFIQELFRQDWETIERLVHLSNLTIEQINNLPSNNNIAKLFVTLLRTYQKIARPKSIRVAALHGRTDVDSRVNMLKKQEDNPQILEMTGKRRVHSADGSIRVLTHETSTRIPLDEMINPFKIGGECIYVTEYAQLVNLAARQAQANGILSSADVFKLTLLASIQHPPGLKQLEKYDYPPEVRHTIVNKELIAGKRLKDEIALLKFEDFLCIVPLTRERIRDKAFVKAIKLENITSSLSFRGLLTNMYLYS